ncbi:MAG: hypothetical protein IJU79_03095 [Desulfovibrionaceae bacterium]|nr:hypothetical protein [Desulfovibrionaceae bacterium]
MWLESAKDQGRGREEGSRLNLTHQKTLKASQDIIIYVKEQDDWLVVQSHQMGLPLPYSPGFETSSRVP